jgi:CheY-like chemotaxis protein
MNLVVNARDAMPSGGRLALETANVDLDANYAISQRPVQPGPYVQLAVSDTGVGMDDETKQRLFEPFFTTKPVGKGTGLGLATVYGIVSQSGGYVWAYSELGQGTTFKIYLPHFDAPDAAAPPAGQADRVARGTRRFWSSRTNRRCERSRASFSSGRAIASSMRPNPAEAQGVFDAHAEAIDMIVTDVVMPGSSGPRLFERLARQRPELRVLYMSGYTDDASCRTGSWSRRSSSCRSRSPPTD